MAGTSLAPIGTLHGSFLFGIEPADHEALDGEAGAVGLRPKGAADVTDDVLTGVMCVRVIVRLVDVVSGLVSGDGTDSGPPCVRGSWIHLPNASEDGIRMQGGQ